VSKRRLRLGKEEGEGREKSNAPLVLLSNVITLGKVDEVDNGLGGKELKLVDDVDLEEV